MVDCFSSFVCLICGIYQFCYLLFPGQIQGFWQEHFTVVVHFFFWVVSLYLLQLLENFPATWLSSLAVWFLLPVETFFFFIWFSLFDLVESCLLFGVFDDECNSAVVGVSSVFLRWGWWHFYTFLYIVVFVLLKCFLMFCIDWIKWVEAWRLSYTGYTSIIYKVCKVSLTFSTKEHEGALFWIPVL